MTLFDEEQRRKFFAESHKPTTETKEEDMAKKTTTKGKLADAFASGEQKVQTQIAKVEKGDTIEAVYCGSMVKSMQEVDKKTGEIRSRQSMVHILDLDGEGDQLNIWGSADLDNALSQIPVGTAVRITNTGETRDIGGGRNPMALYEVVRGSHVGSPLVQEPATPEED